MCCPLERVSCVLSLCIACPCERKLSVSHLAARCIATSPGLLRWDSSLLHESIPQHQSGDGAKTRSTLSEKYNFWSFAWMPSSLALWTPTRGVSLRLGVGEWIQRRKISFFGCDAKFSHSFGPWQKESSKERAPEAQIALHLMRKILYFTELLRQGVFFVTFPAVATKLC